MQHSQALSRPESSGHIPVQVDNRMRAWYMPNMSLGLLYNCTLGDIRPDYPVALVANHNHDGADFMEVIPTENQVPAQREQVSCGSQASPPLDVPIMPVLGLAAQLKADRTHTGPS